MTLKTEAATGSTSESSRGRTSGPTTPLKPRVSNRGRKRAAAPPPQEIIDARVFGETVKKEEEEESPLPVPAKRGRKKDSSKLVKRRSVETQTGESGAATPEPRQRGQTRQKKKKREARKKRAKLDEGEEEEDKVETEEELCTADCKTREVGAGRDDFVLKIEELAALIHNQGQEFWTHNRGFRVARERYANRYTVQFDTTPLELEELDTVEEFVQSLDEVAGVTLEDSEVIIDVDAKFRIRHTEFFKQFKHMLDNEKLRITPWFGDHSDTKLAGLFGQKIKRLFLGPWKQREMDRLAKDLFKRLHEFPKLEFLDVNYHPVRSKAVITELFEQVGRHPKLERMHAVFHLAKARFSKEEVRALERQLEKSRSLVEFKIQSDEPFVREFYWNKDVFYKQDSDDGEGGSQESGEETECDAAAA